LIQSVPLWLYAVGFVLLLGPLVTVHELGHYLVGRWCGVKADTFSIGFGKEIAGFTDRRGTRWRLSALPLGGYVQFAGDMNATGQPSAEWLALPAEERARTFQAQPLWRRALIVAAGPLTNLLVAVAIFAAFFMAFGKPVQVDPAKTNVIARFEAKSVAQAAGARIGDRVLAIDGARIRDFQDMKDQILIYPGKSVVLTLERDGRRLDVPLTIASAIDKDQFGNEMRVGRIGVWSSEIRFERVGFFRAWGLAVGECAHLGRLMATGLKQVLVGERSVRELGGPIKIAKFSGEQLSLGPVAFVSFVAMISLNLAFINLLPIPALDGGHLAFYAAEAVRRKPLDQRSQEWAFRTGIAFVLALMLFVTINDIVSLPIFGR